jgi:hypothetical protein
MYTNSDEIVMPSVNMVAAMIYHVRILQYSDKIAWNKQGHKDNELKWQWHAANKSVL